MNGYSVVADPELLSGRSSTDSAICAGQRPCSGAQIAHRITGAPQLGKTITCGTCGTCASRGRGREEAVTAAPLSTTRPAGLSTRVRGRHPQRFPRPRCFAPAGPWTGEETGTSHLKGARMHPAPPLATSGYSALLGAVLLDALAAMIIVSAAARLVRSPRHWFTWGLGSKVAWASSSSLGPGASAMSYYRSGRPSCSGTCAPSAGAMPARTRRSCRLHEAAAPSRSTVYELIGRGDLEVVHLGRAARVPSESVRDLVGRVRGPPTSVATERPTGHGRVQVLGPPAPRSGELPRSCVPSKRRQSWRPVDSSHDKSGLQNVEAGGAGPLASPKGLQSSTRRPFGGTW